MDTTELIAEIESLKTEIEMLKEQNEILDILTRYGFRYDLGRYDEWYALFSDDAVFGARTNGLKALQNQFGLTQKEYVAAQHLQLDEVTKIEGDEATSICYQVILQDRKDLKNVVGNTGVRSWTFEKKNGEWLIKTALTTFPKKFPDGSKELLPADW